MALFKVQYQITYTIYVSAPDTQAAAVSGKIPLGAKLLSVLRVDPPYDDGPAVATTTGDAA